MDILFNVKHSTLYRVDRYQTIVSGSYGSINCGFYFTKEWEDYDTKTIVFKDKYNNTYEETLDENNFCVMPDDVIDEPGEVLIAVSGSQSNGSDILNTDYIKIIIKKSIDEVNASFEPKF